ncbi:MAG: hypothetical protein PVG66_15400 [Chromatiales bacterium]|jgi:hypothetical protein
MDERVDQFIAINVTGRVFVACTREGVRDAAQIRRYEKQVRDRLLDRASHNASLSEIEHYMNVEIDRLAQSIQAEQGGQPVGTSKQSDNETLAPDSSAESDKLHMDTGASLESADELSLVDLLHNDCVAMKLLSEQRSRYWQRQLAGGADVTWLQQAVVRELRQALHEQLKVFMRKFPHSHAWQGKRAQQALRLRLSKAETITALLELAHDYQQQMRQQETGKPGLLRRLFSVH